MFKNQTWLSTVDNFRAKTTRFPTYQDLAVLGTQFYASHFLIQKRFLSYQNEKRFLGLQAWCVSFTPDLVANREILVSRKTSGFCAEVVHRGQLILEHESTCIETIFVPVDPEKSTCFIKFDFLPIFCLPGLVPNSELPGSRGHTQCRARSVERDAACARSRRRTRLE